jgi:hypothetical protein
LAHELFKVALYDAVQRYQVAVDVIEDFHGCGLGRIKYSAAPPAKTST